MSDKIIGESELKREMERERREAAEEEREFQKSAIYTYDGFLDPDEAKSFSSTGKLSAGPGQMEGKFFATSKANASTWGSKLGSNNMMSIRVPNSALSHSSVTYFSRLDAIGPAYYFSNMSYLNSVLR